LALAHSFGGLPNECAHVVFLPLTNAYCAA
jgi:hypothetical protein